MKFYLHASTLLFCLLNAAQAGAGDRFNIIKDRLAESECTRFRFLSILESDVFERTDTIEGEATLAGDGRYLITLGRDHYLCDLEHIYSYSADNNQVTVEPVKPDETILEQISFITRLDEFYKTRTLIPGLQYRLTRTSLPAANIPDSMTVTIKRDTLCFDRLEYFDVNEELNRIVFLDETFGPKCPDSLFAPAYPDSVERIRLF